MLAALYCLIFSTYKTGNEVIKHVFTIHNKCPQNSFSKTENSALTFLYREQNLLFFKFTRCSVISLDRILSYLHNCKGSSKQSKPEKVVKIKLVCS